MITRMELQVDTFREPVTQGGSQLGPIDELLGETSGHGSGEGSSNGEHALTGVEVTR